MSADHSPWADDSVQLFRKSVRRFIEEQFLPRQTHWRAQHGPDPEAWPAAGRIGLLLPDLPEDYGGAGGSFAHQAVVLEELARAGVHFGGVIQAVVARYLLTYGSEAQRRRWLPSLARGELVAAIAMTEPDAGSNLQGIKTTARRDGDRYRISGSKTFITNGARAGLVCLAAKTDPRATAGRGISLILVETRDLAGYSTGPALDKIGMHGQDTCELFFDGVEVPAENLLGPAEGKGFAQLMEQLPYERLMVGVTAVAAAERAVELTARYVKERQAFDKTLFDFQNTRFKLAECKTQAQVGRIFIDHCIQQFLAGRLDDVTSAMAKYWLTETQCRIADECLQLHGGYGYMNEYPIARLWSDSRVQRIYAGTNEIMKEVIAWSL
ncbi:MAG: acyl-CoA dehydrogenase [Rhodocyclaceae bacterium]|nr:acyl-CoA dehydrogenase [Rhodocyclaceae bacterium]